MKHILGFLVFVSSAAFACPNLSGYYSSCKTVEGSFPDSGAHSVIQSMNGDVTVFNITSMNANSIDRTTDTYIADGKWYTQEVVDVNTGAVLTYSTQATCNGEFLTIVTKLAGDELVVGLSKAGSQVTQKISGIMMGEQMDAVQVCE